MKKSESFRISVGCHALLFAIFLAGCGVGGKEEVGGSGQPPGPPPTAAGAGQGVGGRGHGPAPLNLGGSDKYAILSVMALTNQGPSQVIGDVGLTKKPGSQIQLGCDEVQGRIVRIDNTGPSCAVTDAAGLNQDELDADAAYRDAIARTPDYSELGDGNIGGMNLGPATYHWSNGVAIPSTLTLTGGPNDVWIFQIMQGLEVAPDVQIILKGGALPQNVFWAPTWTVELGENSLFNGILLPAAPVFMRTGASIHGKLLAFEVHLDHNIIGP